MSQHIWSPNWEKVTGSVSATWVMLQRLPFGVPAYNARIQADIIINLWPNCKPGFMLMLFILLCKTWDVVKPGAWLARLLPGGTQFSSV